MHKHIQKFLILPLFLKAHRNADVAETELRFDTSALRHAKMLNYPALIA